MTCVRQCFSRLITRRKGTKCGQTNRNANTRSNVESKTFFGQQMRCSANQLVH